MKIPTTHLRRRLLAAVLSAALAAPSGWAQAPAAKQEPPTIRATSRLVQVSVIVRDAKGAPVTDLRREDFALFDNGKPQRVASFSFEAIRPAAAGSAPQPLPLPKNTFTNRIERERQSPTSVTVILFDALNTQARDQTYGRNQVAQFLGQLRAEDRVALYALSNSGIKVLHDFAADPAPLLVALEKYRTREESQQANSGPSSEESGMAYFDADFQNILKNQENFQLRDRVARTVDALVAIANHLAVIPGRKNLVWVSGSFPITFGFEKLGASERGGTSTQAESDFAATSQVQATGGDNSSRVGGIRAGVYPSRVNISPAGDPDLLKPPEQGVFLKELERAARALNQAGLAIYPVDARGLVATPPNLSFNPAAAAKNQGPTMTQWAGPDRQSFDTMNLLAERTGGRAYYNTNDIQGSVRQAIDDGSATYELSYYPTHDEWDGKFHEITIRVKRLGADVRHRRGYYAVPDAPADEVQARLDAVAQLPVESQGLSLTARLEPVPGEAGTWNVRMELDAREVSLRHQQGRWMGTLNILFAQKDAAGAIVTSSNQSLDLRLEQDTYDRLLRDGMKMSKSVKIEPSAKELRVVVRDSATGATGSVDVLLSRLSI